MTEILKSVPAVVLRMEASSGTFLCWAMEKHELMRVNLVENTDIQPGAWITVKINERGEVVSYSEAVLELYETKLFEGRAITIKCSARTAPTEYAVEHKKRGCAFNPKIGWAICSLETRDTLRKLRDTPIAALYCCVLEKDFFLRVHDSYRTVWMVFEVSTEINATDADLKARMPWQKEEVNMPVEPSTESTSILMAPYVVVDAMREEERRESPSENRHYFGRCVKLAPPEQHSANLIDLCDEPPKQESANLINLYDEPPKQESANLINLYDEPPKKESANLIQLYDEPCKQESANLIDFSDPPSQDDSYAPCDGEAAVHTWDVEESAVPASSHSSYNEVSSSQSLSSSEEWDFGSSSQVAVPPPLFWDKSSSSSECNDYDTASACSKNRRSAEGVMDDRTLLGAVRNIWANPELRRVNSDAYDELADILDKYWYLML
ncbi:hypothetical protein QR680_015313 [Steinernema hermaphroditum]|uniref:Uncharacterized protein n=1 Tax=Steinernema hermaphroditum TaxID=289476 RepID=A0AA39H8A6_9BILA|nr:hypothetical protein QR680_015313 [Steinernema hermaphroditum]